MATLQDLYDLGKYLVKKTNKETKMVSNMRRIVHEDFKYIQLIGKWICIRYQDDDRHNAIQYKSLRGAMNYVDKWLGKEN